MSRTYTDCVRGMSALIIIVFHVLIFWDFPRVVNLPGSVAVAAFLFLSGYGVNESFKSKKFNLYWRKKFWRIFVPYWIFISIYLLLFSTPDLMKWLKAICFVDSDFWFINNLVKWYIAYYIGRRFFQQHLFIWLLLCGIISLNFLPHLESEQSFSFVAGVLISNHIERCRKLTDRQLTMIAATCMLLGVFMLLLKEIPAVHAYRGTLPYHYILLFIKLPLSVLIILLPHFVKILLKSRVLHILGISSLESYLVHLPLVIWSSHDMKRLLLSCVLIPVLTYVFYIFNRKILLRFV